MNVHAVANVLIPARNAAPFIKESLESVLSQKCSSTFNVIVINDHSTDQTADIVKSLMNQNTNLYLLDAVEEGVSNALNFAVNSSQSEIIIRHDADDVMMPGRLEEQINFLISEKEYSIYGGQISFMTKGESISPNSYPQSDKEIRRFISIGNPFAHPTVAMRRSSLIKAGLYNSDFDGAEDYELWTRLIYIGKAGNSPNVLTRYRVHESQVTISRAKKVQTVTIKVQTKLARRNFVKGNLPAALVSVLVVFIRIIKAKFRK